MSFSGRAWTHGRAVSDPHSPDLSRRNACRIDCHDLVGWAVAWFLLCLALFAGIFALPASAQAVFGPPTFSLVTDTAITVKPPTLPTGASQMALQRKLTRETDAQFTTVATGITTASTVVTGLLADTSYTFRYTSNAAAPNNIGTASSCVTLLTRTTPGLVSFSDLSATGVTVKMPPIPPGGVSLRLEVRPGSSSTFTVVQAGLSGGDSVKYTYTDTERNHFFRAVAVGGTQDLAGDDRAPTTLAEAPVLVTGSVTASSFTVNCLSTSGTVWDSAGKEAVDGWELQKRIQGSGESGWNRYLGFSWGYLLYSGTPFALGGLAPNTTYEVRYVTQTAGGNGISYGAVTAVTTGAGTQPNEPGFPTFTNIGPYSLGVVAPALPARAHHLLLEYRNDGFDWTTLASNVSAGSTTTVNSLAASTLYRFRFWAVPTSGNSTAGPLANITTTSEDPEIPNPPTLGATTSTTQVLTLPAIQNSARTASLTLQYKLSGDPDTAFADVSPTQRPGNTVMTVSGLTSGRLYTYRTKANSINGVLFAYSTVVEKATTAAAPAVPGAPANLAIIDPYTVDVTAPTLPVRADFLTLQGLPVNEGKSDDDYVEILAGLAGGAVTRVSGLTPGATYRFRYSATGSGGVTTPANTVYLSVTMPAYSGSWQTSGTFSTAIQCKGIRTPSPAAGTVTVARGATLRVSSYLATDWDQRNVTATVNGTPVSFAIRYSDTCIYTWSVVNSSNVAVGSFANGLNQAQTTKWVAPSTAGTYTLKLVVSDQHGANMASGEGGTRSDPDRTSVDTPLTFKLTISVP